MLVLWPRGDEKDEAYLLGVCCRRFRSIGILVVSSNCSMDFHIFNALPIPRPTRDNPLWQRVVALSGRLAAVDERYAEWAAAVGVDYGPLDPPSKTT